MTGEATPFGKFLERWQWPNGWEQYVLRCPGCQCTHAVTTKRPGEGAGKSDAVWGFNNNPELPTFTPSLLAYNDQRRCHSFITNGAIQYLSDCTHELAGKTISMVPFAPQEAVV